MASNSEKMANISKWTYEKQAIWMLNGFWQDLFPEAETIYAVYKKFVELDLLSDGKKGKGGNELDQFWAAKLLEELEEALPALARKEALKTIDQDNNGCMSLVEYVAWKYKKTVDQVANAPQADASAQLVEAQKKFDAVQQALTEIQSLIAQLKEEREELKKVEAEQKAAVAEVQAQEDALAKQLADLEEASKAGGVKGGKAANELAQLKLEDPLPLRKAKITQEAALRKVERAQKKIEKLVAENEAKIPQLEKELQDASAAVQEAKASSGAGNGSIWWMERVIFEADAYVPEARQKFDHSKPFKYTEKI